MGIASRSESIQNSPPLIQWEGAMDHIETQSPCFKKLADEIECRLPEGEDNTVVNSYVS